MATFELTEYPLMGSSGGIQLAVPPLPYVKHSIVTIGPGEEIELQSTTRFIEICNASADFRFKAGPTEASVTGDNAPTETDAKLIKTTDPDRAFAITGSSWIGTV